MQTTISTGRRLFSSCLEVEPSIDNGQSRSVAAELIDSARHELAAAGGPGRAPAMQEHMQSDIAYYGVRLPDIRRIWRPIVAAHPIESARAFDDTVEKLFVAVAHREVRYAAV